MNKNPFISPIRQTVDKIENLEFHGGHLLPSIVVAIILFLVITILVILIPYGGIYQAESFFRNDIVDKWQNLVTNFDNALPTIIELLVYFILWLIFAIPSIPFYVIHLIAYLIKLALK